MNFRDSNKDIVPRTALRSSILHDGLSVLAVMGLVGVLAVTIMSVPEDAEARGCNNGVAFNAIQGRCFGH